MRYVAQGRSCTKRKVQIMKAAIYCRLSKEDEDKIGESESIQNQKSMLIQYAMEKGFELYQIYSDEDYSGIDRNRPAFNAMIEAASEHKFDVVLAKTQSRFTRDMELVEKISARKVHGVGNPLHCGGRPCGYQRYREQKISPDQRLDQRMVSGRSVHQCALGA